ncbi:MAG: sulfurtransferase FdhD [Myxococcales bacterium]|nr:sulfurtransferase FdhD [Myxococcales bacterium]
MSDERSGELEEATRSAQVWRVEGGAREEIADQLVREEPLELRLRDVSVAVLMRTPGADEELACGFAVTEGIVADPRDVRFAAHCRRAMPVYGRNVINLMVPDRLELDLERLRRNTFASSSCGVCGKATIDAVFVRSAPPELTVRVSLARVREAVAQMRASQRVFEATGGLHAAGLVNLRTGRLLAVREDVGRHNAVDKVIGRQVLRRALPLRDHMLVVSGRIGFEIAQKARVAGIPVMAAISAPSSLAVDLARKSGMVMIGFVRSERLNVYAGEKFIDLDE